MKSGSQAEQPASGDSISRILRERNKETFDAAKGAIMQRVLLATVQEAIEDLGSPDQIAEKALQHIVEGHAALRDAIDTVQERLVEQVARRSTEELADPEATALRALERIEDDHKAILKAKNLLKMRLVEAVARRSAEELADTEAVVKAARARINDNEEGLLAGKEALTNQLIAEIADRSIEALADGAEAARRARDRIEDEHPTVVGAVEECKTRLIAEIARRTTETLVDPEDAARQAQALIGEEHTILLKAIDHLKNQLLESIVQESLARISDEMGGPTTTDRPPQPKAGRKSYVKTEVVEVAEPTPASDAPPTASTSTTPQMLRRKAANGYAVDERALPEKAQSQPDPVKQAGFYIHGIVSGRGLALSDLLAGLDLDPAYALHVVPYKALAAIVSSVPACDNTTTERAWHNAIRPVQESILEHVNGAGWTVLPLHGALAHPNKAHLIAALAAHVDTLDHALKHLAGKQEWNVKIYCDPEKVRPEVYSNDATIDTFLGQFLASVNEWSQAGPEAELGALQEGMDVPLAHVIETILNNCEKRVHRALCDLSEAAHVAPASEDSVFGNNRMVLNASYLVNEKEGALFRSTLERLSTDYERLGLVYYIGGPHPPCRFASPEAPPL